MNTEKLILAAQWLKDAEHVVAFTGAGVSTPSGIPDFRSPDCGLWENADPMIVASLANFRKNPQDFYNWVRPLVIAKRRAIPNPAHVALYDLERHGKLQTVITQNTDSLHTRAGNQDVIELHGHMRTATCLYCFHQYDNEPFVEQYLEDGAVPRCKCGGTIKPDVILFGEQLPYEALQAAKKASRSADVMLVVGTSLEVAPASDIPLIAQRNGAKVIIVNLGETMMPGADLIIHGDAAEILPAIVQYLETIST